VSYKIVDQIKKSHVPATLKKVLEAYVTFGNRDGTSIRPTEAAVAERASASRITISRRTQTLVALGLLVHDLDEKGYWLKYAYGENGVWAYVRLPRQFLSVMSIAGVTVVEPFMFISFALLYLRMAALSSASSKGLASQLA
jgi:hypothetical protein